MTQARVVVTGLGATTPLGGDVASTWAALLAGQSGVKKLEYDWIELIPVRIGAPVAVEPTEVLERVEARRLDRSGQLATVAAREAWADAGFSGKAEEAGLDPTRVAVVIATGMGGLWTLLSQYDVLKEKGSRRISPLAIPMLMPNASSGALSIQFGARGGARTPVSACASGNEALTVALDLFRSGEVDVVVAGGTEAVIHPLPMAAFGQMTALSTRNDEPERASRPFDKGRDGFVLGEGAGILVLETAEHAERRGARTYAELAGYGITSDAHHIAQPDPDSKGVIRALQLALQDSGIAADEVRHINAHATSTPAGDVAESQALRTVLGKAADHAAVTATKSMTGHLLGAAGAVEAIALVKAMTERLAPAVANLDDLDDAVDVDIVRGEPRRLPDGPIAGLNNAFGFGGHNVSVAFRTL